VLRLAAVVTTGRRTVTTWLRTVREKAAGPMASSPRVFAQRRRSAWARARPLITCLLDQVVPPGPGLLAGDETVTEPPGPCGLGQGRQRDGVRAPPGDTAYPWGPKWVVVAGLVKLPCAARPRALPVLAAVYRPPAGERGPGPRPKTPAPLARRLLARRMRWFPARHFLFVGDSGDGPSETARLCRTPRQHLPVVRTFSGEAALDGPPPPRPARALGRPRVKGQTRASPPDVVANAATRTSLMVTWSGGTTRAIEIVTGTGPWSRLGEALVDGRWVDGQDWTGPPRDEDCLTPELTMKPQHLVEGYTPRWAIDPTLQACREDLQREATQGDGPQPGRRGTPGVCGLYPLVVRRSLPLPRPSDTLRAVFWRGKSAVTFSAMLTCVRRG
jgi:DDE superfamily endonuclease